MHPPDLPLFPAEVYSLFGIHLHCTSIVNIPIDCFTHAHHKVQIPSYTLLQATCRCLGHDVVHCFNHLVHFVVHNIATGPPPYSLSPFEHTCEMHYPWALYRVTAYTVFL